MIGSLLGGMISQGGANAAAGMAQGAANQAYAGNQHQMAVNRSDASPWTAAGTSAVSQIGQLLGWGHLENPGTDGSLYNWTGNGAADQANAFNAMYKTFVPGTEKFQTDPGYDFRLGQGVAALDRSAASKGMILSGAQKKGVTEYGQNFGSNEYQNWFNRYQQQKGDYMNTLAGMSGTGASVVGGVNSANSGLATAGGNALLQGGLASGSATMAGANAMASGVGNAFNNLLAGSYLAGLGPFGKAGGGGKSSYGGTAP